MVSNLYETLEISKDATQEEVRKAYRKQALKTHPDRQPQGITPEQKCEAEEQFRLVNNAYEVLNNPQNRAIYDRVGEWPPPQEEPVVSSNRPSRSRTFPQPQGDPFGAFGFGTTPMFNFPPGFGPSNARGPQPSGPRQNFMFTDPYELFNSLFDDMNNQMNSSLRNEAPLFAEPSVFGQSSAFPPTDPFAGTPFARNPMFGIPPMFGNDFFADIPRVNRGNVTSSSNTFTSSNFGGRSYRSVETRVINGRKETTVTERDAEGNEHIIHTTPEGERHIINGIEQPPNSSEPAGLLRGASTTRHSTEAHHTRSSREGRNLPSHSHTIDVAPNISGSHHNHRGTSRDYYSQRSDTRSSHTSSHTRSDSNPRRHVTAPVIPFDITREQAEHHRPRRSDTDRTRYDYDDDHHSRSPTRSTRRYGESIDTDSEMSFRHKGRGQGRW